MLYVIILTILRGKSEQNARTTTRIEVYLVLYLGCFVG